MNFSILDALIVIVYLIGIALVGIFTGGKQKSARDYFLSESHIPWWAVCFAIVATETSALTFISIPGIAYISNFNFLQLTLGYFIGRIIVAVLFIPAYFRGELSTAYAFLEYRFGAAMRKTTSIVFLGTRTFADGVRLYTTAIPLALLLKGFGAFPSIPDSTFYIISIVLMAAVTMTYVFIGGVRAVIWTDVIQMFIYFLGAVLSCIILLDLIPGGWQKVSSIAGAQNKMEILHFGFSNGIKDFFTQPYTFIASALGGIFLSMASHGTDQIIVQRILATNNVRNGKRAMVMSGAIVMLQFIIFLFVGTLLYVYYSGAPISSNEVFPKFIIEKIPSGISGLIIAGLLAAAMSTLSGSISALSSATMMDILVPLSKKKWDENKALNWSRYVSIVWCVILIFVAMLFIQTPKSVVELALSIASYTYGGLLGVFLLGTLTRRVNQHSALIGFFFGITSMTIIILTTSLAWTWYTLVGSSLTFSAALIAHRLIEHRLIEHRLTPHQARKI